MESICVYFKNTFITKTDIQKEKGYFISIQVAVKDPFRYFPLEISFTNVTRSFGVQSKILHNFSSVSNVIFLLFFKVSKVRLSIPDFNNLYCETPLIFMVFHNGL